MTSIDEIAESIGTVTEEQQTDVSDRVITTEPDEPVSLVRDADVVDADREVDY